MGPRCQNNAQFKLYLPSFSIKFPNSLFSAIVKNGKTYVFSSKHSQHNHQKYRTMRIMTPDEGVTTNVRSILEGYVIIDPRYWDPRPEAYTDWRAIRFWDKAKQARLILLLEKSPHLFLCSKFVHEDTVFIPGEVYAVLDRGELKTQRDSWSEPDHAEEQNIYVRFHMHLTDSRINESLSRKRGSRGWYKAIKMGNRSVSTVCLDFAPLENVVAIVEELRLKDAARQ